METFKRKLVTIITESIIERIIVEEIMNLGAHGYTIVEARGGGSRGTREAEWAASINSRIETICDSDVASAIASHLMNRFSRDYAIVIYLSDVEVLRPEKFS